MTESHLLPSRWRRIVVAAGGVLAIAALATVGFVYTRLRASLPDYESEIAASGLAAVVEIRRDAFGVPHVRAESDADAYLGLGFAMAQDRLLQMELARRAVRGRLAEILGPDLVETDRVFRTITAGRSPEATLAALPPEVAAAFEAFAAGVNRYLEARRALPPELQLLGIEPEPWQASDSVGLRYYVAWLLNVSFRVELLHDAVIGRVGAELAADLFVDSARGFPAVIPSADPPAARSDTELLRVLASARHRLGAGEGGASNGWVVAGERSSTGMPLLANDMHLEHGMPGIWYEAHLTTPGMNVAGVLVPGVPFVMSGASDHVAFGLTSLEADDSDYYRERLDRDDPDRYEDGGTWRRMEVRSARIDVRGAAPVEIRTRLTRHGPVVSDLAGAPSRAGEALAMRWTAAEHDRESVFLYRLNRARSVAEIEAAIGDQKCPGTHWMYGDDRGEIGHWAAMAIPIREGFDGSLPVPGWDGRHEWQGYVPTSEQPHRRNPAEGWIATANNQVDARYPHVISNNFAMPDRFVRIREMLLAENVLDVDDFARMQMDEKVVLADEWIPLLSAALASRPLSPLEGEARRHLTEWDRFARAGAVGPSIFYATVQRIVQSAFRERLGDALYEQYAASEYPLMNALRNLLSAERSPWFDDPRTPAEESRDDLLARSFSEGVADLAAALGDEPGRWAWDRLHSVTFPHPFAQESPLLARWLNVGPLPIGGGIETVNPVPWRITDPWGSSYGASMRTVIDLARPERSRIVLPAGISGHPWSPHYDDQVDLWLNGRSRPLLLAREDVERATHYLTRLRPH